ncbi:hypothetical protein [Brachybacterium sp. SW0106-09]|uniref:hypothetical protein n=1 Tax=Brachybacterium sp. SW0106-09 TaxID=1704590 RepID=UPI000ABA331E|nr:hypothetical protein [Brachybacterium sp. SW0106-09]
MRPRTITAAAAAVLLLAACSSPESSPPPTTEATTTEGATVEEAAPEETTPALLEYEMGQTHTTELGSEITVHETRLDIPWNYPPDEGGLWHAADVEYCVGDTTPDPLAFQDFTWSWVMRTDEGHTLGHPGSWEDAMVSPRLDLTSSTPIPNECYRGWVLFSGPEDATPVSVRLDNMDWAI